MTLSSSEPPCAGEGVERGWPHNPICAAQPSIVFLSLLSAPDLMSHEEARALLSLPVSQASPAGTGEAFILFHADV